MESTGPNSVFQHNHKIFDWIFDCFCFLTRLFFPGPLWLRVMSVRPTSQFSWKIAPNSSLLHQDSRATSHFSFHADSATKGSAGDCLGLTLISPTCNKPEGIWNCREQQAAITWPLPGPSQSWILWHSLNIQQSIPSLKQTEVIFSGCLVVLHCNWRMTFLPH